MNNEQLSKFQIFEDLSDENLSLFHDILEVVEIEKGKNFINEGDHGDSIYLLLKGEVQVNQVLTLSIHKGELDKREKEVILLYFGLKGEDSKNLEEIGRKMDLTGERIRQIKNRALQRLRHSTRSLLLKIYLE